MAKKGYFTLVLACFVFSHVHCSRQAPPKIIPRRTSSGPITEAKKFPEIQMKYTYDDMTFKQKGKITGMDETSVAFLPFPYWNADPIWIEIYKIDKIKIFGKNNPTMINAFAGCVLGFTISFITGIRSAGNSPAQVYKEDYEAERDRVISKSIGIASLGAGLGALIDMIAKSQSYNIGSKPIPEKRKILREILGI